MKWFLSVCGLVAGVAIAVASCGPKEDFCPTTNPDPMDFTCHGNNDAMSMGGTSGGLCDGGLEYICAGKHQCTPC
jgi:hypothetical protein